MLYFGLVIKCQHPEEEAHIITQCDKPLADLQPNSTCSFSCEPGFELQGAYIAKCSEDGQWSSATPTCKGKKPYLHVLQN